MECFFSACPSYSRVRTRDGNPYPKNLPAFGKKISAKSNWKACWTGDPSTQTTNSSSATTTRYEITCMY